MKKLLLVLAVAGFVACNNEKKEGEKTESTEKTTETPKQDTSNNMMSGDTTTKAPQ